MPEKRTLYTIYVWPCSQAEGGWLRRVTGAWQAGKVSNLDYLLFCNLAAGRSFNDLTQWPVFPWVLSDYRSARLDLDDPAAFRWATLISLETSGDRPVTTGAMRSTIDSGFQLPRALLRALPSPVHPGETQGKVACCHCCL